MVNVILLLTVFFLLVLLSFVWPPDSPWSPKWRTKRTASQAALKLAKVSSKDSLYELGCGDGEVVLSAVRDFGANAVGVEIDPIRYAIACLRVWKSNITGKAVILRKDFKKVDLTSATVVYMYLVPRAMEKLIPKLKKELKPGSKIITYRYQIPLKPLEKKIKQIGQNKKEEIYLYSVI